MGSPDFTFTWAGAVSGERHIRMYFAEPPTVASDDLAELVDGAAHAHDEDVLEAVVRSFAVRHGLEVVSFVTAPDHIDPDETTVTVELRASEVRFDQG